MADINSHFDITSCARSVRFEQISQDKFGGVVLSYNGTI